MINEPAHKKMLLITLDTSKGSGESAFKRRPVRAFVVRKHLVEASRHFEEASDKTK